MCLDLVICTHRQKIHIQNLYNKIDVPNERYIYNNECTLVDVGAALDSSHLISYITSILGEQVPLLYQYSHITHDCAAIPSPILPYKIIQCHALPSL
mmetsp:Transcript_6801/g.10643  ORF Transcript_6801/g.10643 Transcript_6801/m.10643 type:complete len:97 (-) Transcript_6801:3024-3314(-)